MQLGEWKLTPVMAGKFGLDGGAMFGVVPRTLWEKRLPPDDRNRISMVMRCLVAEGHGKRVLIDVGAGGGHDEKLAKIYKFEKTETLVESMRGRGIDPASITDVLLTHLHFDHAAGIVEHRERQWELLFPQARHHVQLAQWEHALKPNPRDRASYFQDRLIRMEQEGVLELHDGPWRLTDDFELSVFNGHSPGQQLPLISGGGDALFFGGDVVPTQHHIPTPYIMAYDLLPVVSMEEKVPILEQIAAEGWILFFEHDAHLAACRLERDGKHLIPKEIPFD